MKQTLHLRGMPCSKPKLPISLIYFIPTLFIILFVSCVCARAQVSASPEGAEPAAEAVKNIKPLKIGDTIPQALWNMPLQMVRAGQEGTATVTLKEYKDKLIILDFWATWCAPCISSLYKLDTLQQQFKEDVAIIPVAYENEKKVRLFFRKKGWDLPTVYADIFLKEMFPHRILPHQVWINNGKVYAITNSEYTNRSNIRDLINGKKVQLLKKTDNADFDPREPLFILKDNMKGVPVMYQTGITKYIEGVSARVTRPNRSSMVIYNVPVIQLYRIAYEDSIPYLGQFNRVLVRLDDSLKNRVAVPEEFKLTGNLEKDRPIYEWIKENKYCYSAMFHDSIPQGMRHQIIRSDINRFFGLHLGIKGEIRKELVKCLIMVNKEKGADANSNTLQLSDSNKNIVPFKEYASRIIAKNRRLTTPILDETENLNDLNVEITAQLKDLDGVRQDLRRYGIEIIEGHREMDVLVISKK